MMKRIIDCTINWIIGYIGVMVIAFCLGVLYGIGNVVYDRMVDQPEQGQQY